MIVTRTQANVTLHIFNFEKARETVLLFMLHTAVLSCMGMVFSVEVAWLYRSEPEHRLLSVQQSRVSTVIVPVVIVL